MTENKYGSPKYEGIRKEIKIWCNDSEWQNLSKV